VTPKSADSKCGMWDIASTLRVYVHITPNMQQAAADTMQALFGEQEVEQIPASTGVEIGVNAGKGKAQAAWGPGW
jgi:hypothetical protein